MHDRFVVISVAVVLADQAARTLGIISDIPPIIITEIWSFQRSVPHVFEEVVRRSGLNVVPVDCDKIVSIRSLVFMPHPEQVHKLVDDDMAILVIIIYIGVSGTRG